MNDEARLLLSIWEAVQDYIPTGDRQEAALGVIKSLVELGNDLELLHDAEGECPYLDRALNEAALDQDEEIDDIYEEED